MTFYKSHLPTCDTCNKPASFKILGRGNENYGYACARHADQHVKRLEKAYARESESTIARANRGEDGGPVA